MESLWIAVATNLTLSNLAVDLICILSIRTSKFVVPTIIQYLCTNMYYAKAMSYKILLKGKNWQ